MGAEYALADRARLQQGDLDPAQAPSPAGVIEKG
jgi:hypothetical protein